MLVVLAIDTTSRVKGLMQAVKGQLMMIELVVKPTASVECLDSIGIVIAILRLQDGQRTTVHLQRILKLTELLIDASHLTQRLDELSLSGMREEFVKHTHEALLYAATQLLDGLVLISRHAIYEVTLLVGSASVITNETEWMWILNDVIADRVLMSIIYAESSVPTEVNRNLTLLSQLDEVWEDLRHKISTLSFDVMSRTWGNDDSNLALIMEGFCHRFYTKLVCLIGAKIEEFAEKSKFLG